MFFFILEDCYRIIMFKKMLLNTINKIIDQDVIKIG